MNSYFLQFEPVVPLSLVLGVAMVLILVFGGLELKRNARFLVWRLIAVFVSVISVCAMVLRPSFLSQGTSDNIIVLTPHYIKSQVDSLHRLYPQHRMVTTAGAEEYPGAERLTDNHAILEFANAIRYVVGDGLPEYYLPMGARYIKGELPTGIIQLKLPERIISNRKYSILGLWNGAAASLVLKGPGGKEDSIRLNRDQSFELKFQTRQPGRFEYTINIRSEDRVWEEKLPIEVHEPEPLRILIWQQYPSAETRFLKNFLIEQNHQVIVRTQISKSNYRLEYGNQQPIPVNRITHDLLKQFDVLILANESTPTTSEFRTMERAVQDGLGVLWLPAEAEISKPPFGLVFTQAETDTVHIKMEGSVSVFQAWPVQSQEVIPIISNANRVVAGYINKRAGKIGYNLLPETYPLRAKAESEIYGALWTRIIESIARVSMRSTVIRLDSKFPIYTNEPVRLSVISMLDGPKIWHDSLQVPLRESLAIDQYWNGTAWPVKTGWHQVQSPADSVTLNFYSFDRDSWQALRATNLQRSTGMMLTGNTETVSDAESATYRKINPVWFFMTFLLATGFLWLAPKV